ncbi:uncharacterized protein LOC134140497 isoform X2 [Rhea pennata]
MSYSDGAKAINRSRAADKWLRDAGAVIPVVLLMHYRCFPNRAAGCNSTELRERRRPAGCGPRGSPPAPSRRGALSASDPEAARGDAPRAAASALRDKINRFLIRTTPLPGSSTDCRIQLDKCQPSKSLRADGRGSSLFIELLCFLSPWEKRML